MKQQPTQRCFARLLRRHGMLGENILANAKSAADLGENFGGGLYERELAYLIEHEWARTGEDVLWRRTKCGLHMSEAQRQRVAEYLAGGR
jgi:glycerol-3-phosphate dehydrogenase